MNKQRYDLQDIRDPVERERISREIQETKQWWSSPGTSSANIEMVYLSEHLLLNTGLEDVK
ncbi:hypothetical protein [Paenibacillus sp. FSL H8-0034]|uniref:hypothetical protein n=1 Tax=Paenibacillus sp. FSL H8-0034 TaxID=2954671 RepID=UPI0030F73F5C